MIKNNPSSEWIVVEDTSVLSEGRLFFGGDVELVMKNRDSYARVFGEIGEIRK